MKKTLALVCLALSVVGTRSPVAQTQSSAAEFVAGEVLIQFRPDATAANRADARSWVGAARRALLRRNEAGELEVARTGRSVEEAVALLRTHPAVRYAEPNWIYRHQETSNDTLYITGQLWGMYGDTTTPVNQYGSQAGEAWEEGNIGDPSVAVGVIDEGIDLNHPDLADNIWTNPVEKAGVPGWDDDNNGYIDDLHGWDFSENNNSVYDGSPTDSNTDSHGTHVSGTIGGRANTQGVAGVNWNVTIIPAKFLGPSGGTLANAIRAIDYITNLQGKHGLKIVATNNSWGGGGFSQALLDAIVRAANANILFVAAAGNGGADQVGDNNDTTPNFPSNYNTTAGAGYDAVIAVASITSSGARSSFSNYGKITVDLGAPGSGIYSTTPNGGYSSFSGTSMATPHVTGAVALYASLPPPPGELPPSASKIKNAILASAAATPTASLNNITVTNGRLNIGQFAGPPPPLPPPPPAAPSNLTAAAVSSSQINLGWGDNSDNETGFEIHRCQGATCTNFTLVASVGAKSFSNTGLSPSTLYRYQVRAFNGGGTSGFSTVAEATTQDAPPAAPSTLTAKPGPGGGLIDLAWKDNSSNEDVFKIERCQGGSCNNFAQIAQVGANVTSHRDTNRSKGRTYRYRVRGFNAAGNSGYSNIASAKAP